MLHPDHTLLSNMLHDNQLLQYTTLCIWTSVVFSPETNVTMKQLKYTIL